MKKEYTISGPYFKFSSPYGKVHHTLDRDKWYVNKKLTEKDLQNPNLSKLTKKIYSISKEKCLGSIVKFRNRDDYIIDQLHPTKAYKTLKGAINFLIRNEGKLVFCT